jgi:hypothetical protein
MSLRSLLRVSAAIEVGAGVAALLVPRLLVTLLFGPASATPLELVLARFVGIALLSLGMACWWAANDPESRAAEGVVKAMLLYDIAAAVLLLYAATSGLTGIVLWPAIFLHSAMAVWCILGPPRSKEDALAAETEHAALKEESYRLSSR